MTIGAAQFTSTPVSQGSFGGDTTGVAKKPISNIGDLLQSASGLSTTGTVTQALTAGQTLSAPSANSTLAANLNPAVTLSPSTTLQVADFVDTSQNAFPTAAPASDQSATTDTTDTTDTSTSTAPSTDSTTGTQDDTSAPPPAQDSSVQTGIYNAVASASASTIRGTGVDTSA